MRTKKVPCAAQRLWGFSCHHPEINLWLLRLYFLHCLKSAKPVATLSLEKPQKRPGGMGRVEALGRSWGPSPGLSLAPGVTPAGFFLCLGQQKQPSLCGGVGKIKSELRHKQRGKNLGGSEASDVPVPRSDEALVIRQPANQAWE